MPAVNPVNLKWTRGYPEKAGWTLASPEIMTLDVSDFYLNADWSRKGGDHVISTLWFRGMVIEIIR